MEAVAIEARVTCRRCGQVTPLDGFGQSTTCTACAAEVGFSDDEWHALVQRRVAQTHEAATCPSCKAPLPDEAAQFAGRGWMMCPACGTRLAIRVAPPALASFNATFLVGESATAPAAAAPAGAPTMFACLACRAPIRVDGGERFPACGQCGVANHLPDEVWNRMHPRAPASRWYLCLGKGPAAAAAAPESSAVAAVAATAAAALAAAQAHVRDAQAQQAQLQAQIAQQAQAMQALQAQQQMHAQQMQAQALQAQQAQAAALQAHQVQAAALQAQQMQALQAQQMQAQQASQSPQQISDSSVAALFAGGVAAPGGGSGKQIIISHGQIRRSTSDEDDAYARERRLEREKEEREWSSLDGFAIDPEHRIYCGGDLNSTDSVWCMDRQLNLLWTRKDLDITDIKVTYDPQAKRVLAWSSSKHSVIALDAATGGTLGTLGGQESNHATVHGLDMDPCKQLVADHDGSMIALMGDRLVRYDPQGNGIPTWPPQSGLFGAKREKLYPLFEVRDGRRHVRSVERVHVEEVGSHPTVLYSSTGLAVGWDGRLYAEYSEHIACWDRTGKRVYRIHVPLDNVEHLPAADAQGNLYVCGYKSGDPQTRMVLRVAPDGSRVDVVSTDRIAGGLVGSEDKMVVAPDGTIYLLGSYMRLRVLSPVGNLVWQSPKSVEQDAEDDAEAARRA